MTTTGIESGSSLCPKFSYSSAVQDFALPVREISAIALALSLPTLLTAKFASLFLRSLKAGILAHLVEATGTLKFLSKVKKAIESLDPEIATELEELILTQRVLK
jgi:hypothetical protein